MARRYLRGEGTDQEMNLVETVKKLIPILAFSGAVFTYSLSVSSQELPPSLQLKQETSLEEELLSLKNKKGNPVFDTASADHYIALKEINPWFDPDPELALKLIEVEDPKGHPLLQDGNEILSFLSAGGTLSDLKAFAKIIDPKGHAVFDWWQMADLLRTHIPMARIQDTVRVLSVLNQTRDKPGFNHYDQWSFLMRGGTPLAAIQLASVTDPLDPTQSFFLNGTEEDRYLMAGGKAEEAKTWASLRDHNQHTLFRHGDGDLITWAIHEHHDLSYLKHLIDEDYDTYVIRQFLRGNLDLDAGCFMDTDKPNAVLLYAEKDHNGAFDTLWDAQLILQLREYYDVMIRTVATLSEVCEAVSEVPVPELLIENSHGIRTTFFLSTYDRRQKERVVSFFSDLSCLQKLHSQAVVFLRSCSTGEGGAFAFNIANTVAEQVPGRTVISSQELLRYSQINLLSFYPFAVTLSKYANPDQDMSYVAQK